MRVATTTQRCPNGLHALGVDRISTSSIVAHSIPLAPKAGIRSPRGRNGIGSGARTPLGKSVRFACVLRTADLAHVDRSTQHRSPPRHTDISMPQPVSEWAHAHFHAMGPLAAMSSLLAQRGDAPLKLLLRQRGELAVLLLREDLEELLPLDLVLCALFAAVSSPSFDSMTYFTTSMVASSQACSGVLAVSTKLSSATSLHALLASRATAFRLNSSLERRGRPRAAQR